MNVIKSFFRDKNGKTVVWQWPNLPLFSWLVFKLLSLIIATESLQNGFRSISTASLFVWSYLEISDGATMFRRSVGILVFAMIIFGYFSHELTIS